MTNSIAVIAHNIRSVHNVGSLLRTCDGMGIGPVYFTGYTPYPKNQGDDRLPHLAEKLNKQIAKTALGAEMSVEWHQSDDVNRVLDELRSKGYRIVALEQHPKSIKLQEYKYSGKIALILGSEVEGIGGDLIELSDEILEIPMLGEKESFNVVEAATMVFYHCRYVA